MMKMEHSSHDKQAGSLPANRLHKSVENTVFVRFVPASPNIRRHHLESLFSQVGPIKKSSVIHNKGKGEAGTASSSYGFVKYTTHADAALAARRFNHQSMIVSSTESVQLRVELASADTSKSTSKVQKTTETATPALAVSSSSPSPQPLIQSSPQPLTQPSLKKTSRLILRNLSFYAKESHIRQALQGFGELVDVHIPRVQVKDGRSTHRGFAFVTFASERDAKACVRARSVDINKRHVQIEFCVNKTAYEHQKDADNHHHDHDDGGDGGEGHYMQDDSNDMEMDDVGDREGVEGGDDDENNATSESNASHEASDDGEHDDEDDDNDSQSDRDTDADGDNAQKQSTGESKHKKDKAQADMAVQEQRCLFVRNLPFDTTRHDLFEMFRKYGHITSIYIVKDSSTGMPKGTAFVAYKDDKCAQRAIEVSKQASFVSLKQVVGESTTEQSNGDRSFVLRGRSIFVNLAVDKTTAEALTLDKQADTKLPGKDRRNMYLKSEGRIDSAEESQREAWNNLPESDQQKRQRAWKEKNTKLRSPIFFINPQRLSIRNLAKHVDEVELKKLLVDATVKGLALKLVSAEDQIAQWRAAGEMSVREIVSKTEAAEHAGESIMAKFDEKCVKKYIPSIYLDRDFGSSKNKLGESRGFAFAEFTHHVHALACLRQLNNNPQYTRDYVMGGKHVVETKARSRLKKTKNAEDMQDLRLPRLIVEFAVENKTKAKQQSEHRAQQQSNLTKQRAIHKEKSKDGTDEDEKKRKKSRGAMQRERKRQRKESEQANGESDARSSSASTKLLLSSTRVSSHADTMTSAKKDDAARQEKQKKKQKRTGVDEHDYRDSEQGQGEVNKKERKDTTKEQLKSMDASSEVRAMSDKRWFE
jgi:nucleolar protein 4